MISGNELRKGNLVYNGDGKIVEVETITHISINYQLDFGALWTYEEYDFDNLNGIPITEEWLLKLGFISSDINNSIRIHFEHCTDYRFEYYITKIPNYHKEDMYFSGNSIANIKYVHQLQNLYFALSGKELTI